MSKARFDTITNKLNLNIKFKNESLLMKIIGVILFFNPSFKNNFITTIGNTVYFPSKEYLEKKNYEVLPIIFHEYVHVIDNNKYKLFKLLYLFPQILAPLALIFSFISWYIALMIFIILILPWPAPWRKKFELRGYKMSLFAQSEIYKEINLDNIISLAKLKMSAKHYNQNFAGSSYYFMWPFGVQKDLDETVDKILSGDILTEDDIYVKVKELLTNTRDL